MDHMVCYLDTTIWWIQNYVIHKRFLKAWTIFDKTKQQRSGANEIGYQKCHFMCLYLLSFTVRVYYVWFLYFNFNSVLKIITNSLAIQRIRYFKIGKNKFALLYNFLANKFRKKKYIKINKCSSGQSEIVNCRLFLIGAVKNAFRVH